MKENKQITLITVKKTKRSRKHLTYDRFYNELKTVEEIKKDVIKILTDEGRNPKTIIFVNIVKVDFILWREASKTACKGYRQRNGLEPICN